MTDILGMTPLMYAAKSGRTESAKILLKRGAQLQAKDLKGLTALHHAARNYQGKFIKMIIKQGMPVDIKDKKQLTAMHHAISGTDQICLSILHAFCTPIKNMK